MHKILVIEDDLDLCELLQVHLSKANYKVEFVHNGQEAIEKLKNKNDIDLILLDIMLPDIEGTKVCLSIRKNVFCPIIFMSAIDDQAYILKAFSSGGDDYIIKPLNYLQLIARIDAAIRRRETYSRKEKKYDNFVFGRFTLNFNDRTLYKDKENVFLSPTQMNLLMFLVENKDMVVSYNTIFKEVWRQENSGDLRSLAVHISNLRNTLENSDCIVSVRNEGYKFDTSKI